MIIRFALRALILIAIILGVHRVCCLSVMDCFEDHAKYKNLSVNDFRFKLNKQDPAIISEIKTKVASDEGILALDGEPYFISYYAYPAKIYKFKKGYFVTSRKYDLSEVDQEWLSERNIQWILSSGEGGKLSLNRLKDVRK